MSFSYVQINLLSSWCVNINNLIKSLFLFLETYRIQMMFVLFLLGANPGFQVERKLEVDGSSEVLQIMQMQAIGIELYGRSLNAFQLKITSLYDQNSVKP
ncbi:hypothetical protein Gotur_035342 [Gossypium turneri]